MFRHVPKKARSLVLDAAREGRELTRSYIEAFGGTWPYGFDYKIWEIAEKLREDLRRETGIHIPVVLAKRYVLRGMRVVRR